MGDDTACPPAFPPHPSQMGEDAVERPGDPGEIERSAAVGDKSPADIGKSLLDVGTRLFTVSSSGPDYDLGLLREWVTWRDEVNAK